MWQLQLGLTFGRLLLLPVPAADREGDASQQITQRGGTAALVRHRTSLRWWLHHADGTLSRSSRWKLGTAACLQAPPPPPQHSPTQPASAPAVVRVRRQLHLRHLQLQVLDQADGVRQHHVLRAPRVTAAASRHRRVQPRDRASVAALRRHQVSQLEQRGIGSRAGNGKVAQRVGVAEAGGSLRGTAVSTSKQHGRRPARLYTSSIRWLMRSRRCFSTMLCGCLAAEAALVAGMDDARDAVVAARGGGRCTPLRAPTARCG